MNAGQFGRRYAAAFSKMTKTYGFGEIALFRPRPGPPGTRTVTTAQPPGSAPLATYAQGKPWGVCARPL